MNQKHRGKHPGDLELFSQKNINKLKNAVDDLSMLLSKGYALKSTMKLVGDRYDLIRRQRFAVERSACSDSALKKRMSKAVSIDDCKNKCVLIDGFNLIITLEAALSGGYIFIGRDGIFRDISSVHGTYKKVEESQKAINLIGRIFKRSGILNAEWLLDSPVSNSGKLKKFIMDVAENEGWDWSVKLVFNPDRELIDSDCIIVSSDSQILDNCKHYIDLAAVIIEKYIPEANIVDLKKI